MGVTMSAEIQQMIARDFTLRQAEGHVQQWNWHCNRLHEHQDCEQDLCCQSCGFRFCRHNTGLRRGLACAGPPGTECFMCYRPRGIAPNYANPTFRKEIINYLAPEIVSVLESARPLPGSPVEEEVSN